MTADHFNGLSPAEAERLALMMEECGEVVQVIGKILRHGYQSVHPDGGPTNRELLEMELGDMEAARDLMEQNSDINVDAVILHSRDKMSVIGRYLHHQPAKL